MKRNWDTEWKELCCSEFKKFKEFYQAQAAITATFSHRGEPTLGQLEHAATARQGWEADRQRIDYWLDEWRASLPK